MGLFDLNEQVAYVVKQVDMITPYAQKLQEQLTSKKLAKKANLGSFITDLTDFKKALAVSSSDRYVGAEESKLREKVSELYGTIATFAGRPSNAQMENATLLTNEVSEAKAKLDQIKKRLEVINQLAQKSKMAGFSPLQLPTWEEFKTE
jgi:hypothetical protein